MADLINALLYHFSVRNISRTLMSGARAMQDNELFTVYTASVHVFPE